MEQVLVLKQINIKNNKNNVVHFTYKINIRPKPSKSFFLQEFWNPKLIYIYYIMLNYVIL